MRNEKEIQSGRRQQTRRGGLVKKHKPYKLEDLKPCQSGQLSIGGMIKTRLQKLSFLNGFMRRLALI